MTRYAGTRAVVIGQDTGIGLAIAKRLVEGGAEVVLAADGDAERTRTELGSAARVVAADALVAGGGPADHGGAAGLWPGDQVEFVFADAVATARPLLPYVADGGAIVLTAASPAPVPVGALAAELAARGIRVNAVDPGCIDEPGDDGPPLPPLGRLGSAEEVARAALFLATEATFTTGARLAVDGGLGRP
ncbi:SDR family oxidoreductase [Streptomyces sp. 8L]|uniref:SDR family oxidoreductase n=1 Tax=Streptomyces sp. 8L TaxID=2877242 RepID=UPI001CD20F1F|nr:SDR family oxidoreductase [Streptomyces sp. 8L]MCA1222718.1 SDR family oxidoreductase [Streptomyces sp. 8L]